MRGQDQVAGIACHLHVGAPVRMLGKVALPDAVAGPLPSRSAGPGPGTAERHGWSSSVSASQQEQRGRQNRFGARAGKGNPLAGATGRRLTMVSKPWQPTVIPSPLVRDASLDQPVRLRHQGLAIGREQDRRALALPRDEGDPAGLRLARTGSGDPGTAPPRSGRDRTEPEMPGRAGTSSLEPHVLHG